MVNFNTKDMQQRKPLYKTVLFTKTPKKDGTFPVKLRISYTTSQNGERKTLQNYYGIPFSFNENDWNRIDSQNARGNYRAVREELNNYETRARDVIDYLIENDGEFSFDKFKDIYFNTGNNTYNLYEAFSVYIDELEREKRLSSAISVKCTFNSLKTFLRGKPITFKEITPHLLKSYEDWMVDEQNNSKSTVGIYMRCIRVLFNMQIAKGLIEAERYPFGRHKYQIPAVDVRDKVISSEYLKALYEYQPEADTYEEKAKDIWFFLYLCNGMNVKDMCRLRYENFREGYFFYSRAKTAATYKQKKDITVVLNENIEKIIDKWGNERNARGFVFPFLNENSSAEDERRITQNIVSNVNDNMNRIAKKLGLDINITTYSARQTFSNVLLNSDAPIKLIADSLGHANSAITEKHYLKKLSIEKQKEFADKLLNF